jgi:hypothetical protein
LILGGFYKRKRKLVWSETKYLFFLGTGKGPNQLSVGLARPWVRQQDAFSTLLETARLLPKIRLILFTISHFREAVG